MTIKNSKRTKKAKDAEVKPDPVQATDPADEQPQQEPEDQAEEPPAEDDNEQPQEEQPECEWQEEDAAEDATAEPPAAEAPAPVEAPSPHLGQQTLPGLQAYGRRLIPDDEGAAIGLHLLALDAEEERMKRDHKFERDELKKRRDEYMDSRGATYELWLRQKSEEERRRKQALLQAEKDARAAVSIASLEEQAQATEPEQQSAEGEEVDLQEQQDPAEGDGAAEAGPIEAAA